jgi:hypothetical protein
MKKIALLLAVGILLSGVSAFAACSSSQDVTITVTIGAAPCITIDNNTWAIGSISAGTTAYMMDTYAGGITLSNTSTSGCSLQIYMQATTVPGPWTIANTQGSEQFSVWATIQTTAPAKTAAGYGMAGNHDIKAAWTAATGVVYAGADQNGSAVAYNTTRTIWLAFGAPTLSAETTVQTIVVRLSCNSL